METKKTKAMVVVGLLVLAGLAVILLPAYAGDLEPIARPGPKRQGVYKVELARDDLIAKATLEEGCGAATATGSSESFSFDEAFENAIHALPEDTTPVYPDKMTTVRVVEIYATFGGITGVAQMYVRVHREADPACLSAAEEQEAEPEVEKIRLHQGEVKKLPGPVFELGEVTESKPIEVKKAPGQKTRITRQGVKKERLE